MLKQILSKIINLPRSSFVLVVFLIFILAIAYSWGRTLYNAKNDDHRVPRQCESVYVGKVPYACQPGELIYVDADVAGKYCTEEVFAQSDNAVYCIYNGERDDRERQPSLFRTSTFGEIDR